MWVYSYPIFHEKGGFHPTQKPVALLEELIGKHSDRGDIVLDCFAGSASTAVAAGNLGRNFIGCEISEEYYQKAAARLSEHFGPGSMEQYGIPGQRSGKMHVPAIDNLPPAA